MSPCASLTQGLLSLPGITAESKALAVKLLEEDLKTHHCYWGKPGFHNHLNHHLLAAYDYGAPASLLQRIYDSEQKNLSPINLINRKENTTGSIDLEITDENWTQHVGPEQHYPAFLKFFTDKVAKGGAVETVEHFLFSPQANGNGTNMLVRVVNGAVHPLIQIGYGVEFNLPAVVASGLAQTAVTSAFYPELVDDDINNVPQTQKTSGNPQNARQPSRGESLLSIMRQVYASEIMTPVMPYDPDALLSKRRTDALKDGTRGPEIRRLAALWSVDPNGTDADFEARAEELIWFTTLLTAGTGRRGRKPRLDFFFMHFLTSSLFIPTFLKALKRGESKARLLRAFVPVMLLYLTIRGRPRIDAGLIMSLTDTPRPPVGGDGPAPDKSALGDPKDGNPWPGIVASVIHAPDAHTVKAIRTLYYAAQKYGTTPVGGAIGAFDGGEETLVGTGRLDGTLFVRAAGVIMDTLGWVSHGQKEGNWDRSALGWDGAWEKADE